MKIVNINGKDYILKMSINGMILFEELSGKALTAIGEGITIKDLRLLFHCCLMGATDLNTSGELLDVYADEHGLSSVGTLIGEVASAKMGKQKSKAELAKITN